MMLFLLWWLSVGFVAATMIYYVDCLEASYVNNPWMIIPSTILWPVLYIPAILGTISLYKYRKEKGDVV